jgi:hypothetical protein
MNGISFTGDSETGYCRSALQKYSNGTNLFEDDSILEF